MPQRQKGTRGPKKSKTHGAELEILFTELDKLPVDPEDVDGKIKEYITLMAGYKIYKDIFTRSAIAISTVRYRIQQLADGGEFENDLCMVPLLPNSGKRGNQEVFLNRKNRKLLGEIFTPQAPGKSYLGLEAQSADFESVEEIARMNREIHGYGDDDDEW